MIDPGHIQISITRQCELLGMSRSSYYYEPVRESKLNITLMRIIDEQYLQAPFLGSRKMTIFLRRQGYHVNRKRVQKLMRLMGIVAIYPRSRLSARFPDHKIYPYLLKELQIEHPNQVWSSDITYLPMKKGFMYLVAVMDLYSRYVLSWNVSNTLESEFCVSAVEEALIKNKPKIFNTDQGVQFTSKSFIDKLLEHNIQPSMDGKGRFIDNIFIERLWRSVKYEDVYIKDYEMVMELLHGLKNYFKFYNELRPHQSLKYRTPEEVYLGADLSQ